MGEYIPIEEMECFKRFEAVADWVGEVVTKWDSLARNTIGKQIVRSADSIGANLVEGDGRYSDRDAAHHFIIARASARETKLWIQRAMKRGLIQAADGDIKVSELISAVSYLITSFDTDAVRLIQTLFARDLRFTRPDIEADAKQGHTGSPHHPNIEGDNTRAPLGPNGGDGNAPTPQRPNAVEANTSTPQHLSTVRSQAADRAVDLSRLPSHIAIIMDGNGRWAKAQGKQRLEGHAQGYATLKQIVIHANDLGIRYLTVYVFSAENWRRPSDEVNGLMALIEHAARVELEEMHANNVRFAVSGRLHEVPEGLQEAMREGIETTKGNTGITFTLALNYGGRAEIVDAVKRLIEEGKPIEEATISGALYNPDHPEPDLMIRTAGEMRWSNFLIWQSAYTELFVTQKPWPEFGLDDLLEAVAEYQKRTRKFGAVVE